MENNVADLTPVLKTTTDSWLTCAVCFKSITLTTYKRKKSPNNLQQIIDIQKFKTRDVQWTNYEHEYSKVFEINDWNKSEIYVHKNCRSSFFQDTFMENKDVKILSIDNSHVYTTVFNESSSSICSTMPRRSKRTSLGETFSLDEKHCVIATRSSTTLRLRRHFLFGL